LISERAAAALGYAQTVYLLPVSLFGMAVSAAELPLMSQVTGSPEAVAAQLRDRLNQGLRRISFFVVPSAVAFLVLGDVVAGAIFQTGRFTVADTRYLWYLLIGSAVGLLAATMGRLYASAFYALRDARTPLYFAALRVFLAAALAYVFALKLPSLFALNRELGAVGITATSGLAAGMEFLLLRRQVRQRIGHTGLPASTLGALWGSAVLAAAVGLAIKLALARFAGTAAPAPGSWEGDVLGAPALPASLTGLLVLGAYGLLYFAFTSLWGVPESLAVVRKFRRRRR
jgi:putative peptidoglycan lipid II flippase